MDSQPASARASGAPPFPIINAPTSVAGQKRKAPPDKATAKDQKDANRSDPTVLRTAKRPKLSTHHGNASISKSSTSHANPVPHGSIDVEMADSRMSRPIKSHNASQDQKQINAPAVMGSNKKTTTARAQNKAAVKGVLAPIGSKNTLLTFQEDDEDGEDDEGDTIRIDVPGVVSSPVSMATFATGIDRAGGIHDIQDISRPVPQAPKAKSQPSFARSAPTPTAAPTFPAINAGNRFNARLPAVHRPWPFRFPQAHDAYSQTTACPINWSTFPTTPIGQRWVYELRRPWSLDPPPWDKVKVELAKLEGKPALSAEGVRKRFAKVNKVIFETTGIYFLFNGHGLQRDYGVPNDSNMPSMLHGDGASKQGKSGKTSKACKISAWKEDRVEEDNVAILVLQLPGQSFRSIRYVTKQIMETLDLREGQSLPYTAATFDRWYSCLCFGRRHTLPKRVYKLKQSPDGYTYVDEGMPPVTMQTLLDTYCLSKLAGTTEVSDMLLDEIMRSLASEKTLYEKYGAGGVCEGDCNAVVRLLDLQPEDIEKLWKNTEGNDAIRRLLVDLFLHRVDVGEHYDKDYEEVRADALRFQRCVRDLWSIFADKHRQKAIGSFMALHNAEHFCAVYHNHHNVQSCYRSLPASARSQLLIDDTTDEPNIHLLEIKGVAWYRIINKTGDRLDLDALHTARPRWEWERVRSVNSWIFIKPKGPQHRQPHPVYFEFSEMDSNGRYPSHPGYQKKKWAPCVDKYDKENE